MQMPFMMILNRIIVIYVHTKKGSIIETEKEIK